MDMKDSELRRCYLFSGLNRGELEKISKIAIYKKYVKGESIFSEGDRALGFFIVCSGKVKIFKLSSDGKEFILNVVSAGEPFAEAAIFSGESYPAYADSLTESRLLFIPRREFLALIEKYPKLSIKMLGTLSGIIRRFNRMIEELSLREVSCRVAKYLLDLSTRRGRRVEDGIEFDLDTNKAQLASRLGTISETLSRCLAKFRKKNLIRMDKNRIVLLDKATLQSIAAGMKI